MCANVLVAFDACVSANCVVRRCVFLCLNRSGVWGVIVSGSGVRI